MTHPHRLHAAAALHSLRAALRHLATASDGEARNIAAELVEAADGLCGWRPMVGGAGRGGHGDPVGGAALFGVEPTVRVNRYERLYASTTDTLRWLGDQLRIPPTPDPLQRLQTAIPCLRPGHCAVLTRWIVEADSRIRAALGMGADWMPIPPDVECPACSVRMLRVQRSAPDTADWTIVCGNRCVCAGDDCPCGMPIRAAGVRHIWDATSPLATGAFAGNAPTITSGKAA